MWSGRLTMMSVETFCNMHAPVSTFAIATRNRTDCEAKVLELVEECTRKTFDKAETPCRADHHMS
jgi:hypothetical protein